MTATLPKRAHKLLALAKKHGWDTEVREDTKPIDGATESAMLAFDLQLASGRSFAISNLEWWLARPESVVRFDWVEDEVAK